MKHTRIPVFLLLGIILIVLSIMTTSVSRIFTSDDAAQQNAVTSLNLRGLCRSQFEKVESDRGIEGVLKGLEWPSVISE
jgi:hypothetical protein